MLFTLALRLLVVILLVLNLLGLPVSDSLVKLVIKLSLRQQILEYLVSNEVQVKTEAVSSGI